MKEKIIEIIVKLTGVEEVKVNPTIDLLENDILDSLSFIELIEFLEEEFAVEIQPTLVSPDTWRSVEKIEALINSLQEE